MDSSGTRHAALDHVHQLSAIRDHGLHDAVGAGELDGGRHVCQHSFADCCRAGGEQAKHHLVPDVPRLRELQIGSGGRPIVEREVQARSTDGTPERIRDRHRVASGLVDAAAQNGDHRRRSSHPVDEVGTAPGSRHQRFSAGELAECGVDVIFVDGDAGKGEHCCDRRVEPRLGRIVGDRLQCRRCSFAVADLEAGERLGERQLHLQDRHRVRRRPDPGGDAQCVDRAPRERVPEGSNTLQGDPPSRVPAHRDRGVSHDLFVVVPLLGQRHTSRRNVPREPTRRIAPPATAELGDRAKRAGAAGRPAPRRREGDGLQRVELWREVVLRLLGEPHRVSDRLDEPSGAGREYG